MSWPHRIIFVRHAQSVGNTMTTDERAQCPKGSNLYALTSLGEQQAEITGAWLRSYYPNPDGFYTSYFTRTRATAALLYHERDPYVDERLAEGQRGVWHVLTRDAVAACVPWEIERKEREGLYHYRPPGGENWPDIELRIRSFNHTLHRRYAGKTVVLVVHGHWLLLWKKIVHHWTIDDAVAKFTNPESEGVVENASVTIYRSHLDARNRNVIIPDPDMPHVVPWEGKLDVSAGSPA